MYSLNTIVLLISVYSELPGLTEVITRFFHADSLKDSINCFLSFQPLQRLYLASWENLPVSPFIICFVKMIISMKNIIEIERCSSLQYIYIYLYINVIVEKEKLYWRPPLTNFIIQTHCNTMHPIQPPPPPWNRKCAACVQFSHGRWHYHWGLPLHGVLPSLAGWERPCKCDLYCDGRSVPPLYGPHRLPVQTITSALVRAAQLQLAYWFLFDSWVGWQVVCFYLYFTQCINCSFFVNFS